VESIDLVIQSPLLGQVLRHLQFMVTTKLLVIRLLVRHIDIGGAVESPSRLPSAQDQICPQAPSVLQLTIRYVQCCTFSYCGCYIPKTPFANMHYYRLPPLRSSLRSGTHIVERLYASPRTRHQFRPSFSSISHPNRRRLLRVEVAQYRPHLVAQSLEWLLAWRGVHWVGREVVEEDAVHNDEADQAPLHNLGPLVPGRLDRLEPRATLEFALKVELLLLGQLAEVRRPCLLCGISIASEVEGRQLALFAAKQAVDEAHRRHGGGVGM
jgi:hypothetical protein